MPSSRLNILSVGTNPNLLYYTWKLQCSQKFNVHSVISDVSADSSILITDELINSKIQFQPDILVNKIEALNTTIKYDIVFLSCKSLQEISVLATVLVPYLSKSTIVLVESTGFVNLESFLKSCLPKAFQMSIFSIICTIDIRKTGTNDYVNLKVPRELFFGEAGTSSAKYSSTTQQNLGALSKLFNYKNTDSLSVKIKSSFLEFLVEQWKNAIPRICFDPLLILFEVSKPAELQQKILAKPLLSGLVTEMITVAKTMSCKLPSGYDNESNLLKTWSDEYTKREIFDNQAHYLESPSLFYNFFHRLNLNIDLLLLQPILMADDHGIKTPYLEFLYATICQYEKLNNSDSKSIFLKRSGSEDDTKILKSELEHKEQLITAEKHKNEKLASQYQALLESNERLASKEIELGNALTGFENLKLEQKQLQSILQAKSKQLQEAEAKIQQLQRLALPLQSVPQQQQSQFQSHSKSGSITDSTTQISHTQDPPQQTTIKKQAQQLQQSGHSVNGNPNPTDLTATTLRGSQLEASQLNNSPEKSAHRSLDEPDTEFDAETDDTEQSRITTSTIKDPGSPPLKLQNPDKGPPIQPQPADEISVRELELQRREQILLNREMELNKKFSQFNGQSRGAPQNAPFAQQQYQNQQKIQNRFNSISNGQLPHQFQRPFQQQPLQQQLQPSIQSRRSTVTALESNQMLKGSGSIVNSVGPPTQSGFNQPVKTTSRKNRKSSFPLGTSNFSDNYNNLIPNGGTVIGAGANNNSRAKRVTLFLQPNLSYTQGDLLSLQQAPQMNNLTAQQPNGFSPQSQPQGLPVPPQLQSHPDSNNASQNSSFSSIPEHGISNGSTHTGLNLPLQINPVSQNNSNSSADLTGFSGGGGDQFLSTDSDTKPLGGVIADIDPNAKDKKKRKSKFGFGKKR